MLVGGGKRRTSASPSRLSAAWFRSMLASRLRSYRDSIKSVQWCGMCYRAQLTISIGCERHVTDTSTRLVV